MKKLIVMRHAKSDWSDSSLKDSERPLNRRGIKDAPRMGKALVKAGFRPDLILLSPAERTNQTAAGLIRGMGGSCPAEFIEDFYQGDPEAFFAALEKYANKAEIILILAHNPGIENFVMRVCGCHERMPTAAAALFECSNEEWQLKGILRPKEL